VEQLHERYCVFDVATYDDFPPPVFLPSMPPPVESGLFIIALA